ncbi:hypothetical protein NDR87_13795 [Nocardia sp. CDC159]|uniref:Uncharacterized protein n=1 Tax=Nocardia pulmonis TaxID=2951408 RepID=A0A9X2IY23_9NOCA|nr:MULTISPECIES: hypothetical protein [Nocardia]MCM6774505.1 hypothetical protein [Nocardia pulmonis]MCM6787429.1 hypothetical protein [Nocardia sp. CDC159]
MNTDEKITIHQLLGRIVYFHVLMIEPALPGTTRHQQRLDCDCCRHRLGVTGPEDPITMPWTVLLDIATSLRVPVWCAREGPCCSVCRVRRSTAAIACSWIDTETLTYADTEPAAAQRGSWCGLIASQIADVFAHYTDTRCAAPHAPIATMPPPGDRFPLAAEQAALWAAPIGRAPVISWLNHCADLGDIAHELHTRRGHHENTVTDRAG